jgi:hypothetical protein
LFLSPPLSLTHTITFFIKNTEYNNRSFEHWVVKQNNRQNESLGNVAIATQTSPVIEAISYIANPRPTNKLLQNTNELLLILE